MELYAFAYAEWCLDQALKMAQELLPRHWINQASGTMAAVFLLQGDILQVQNTLATMISPQIPMDFLHKRYCWTRQAELAIAQGDPGMTLELADRLIRSAPGLPEQGVITSQWKLEGEAFGRIGRDREAVCWFHTSLENVQTCGER